MTAFIALVLFLLSSPCFSASPTPEPICTQAFTHHSTPPELLQSARKCIEDEKYSEAVLPYVLSVAYGTFDTDRVADLTAHEVFTVLQVQELGSMEKIKVSLFNTAKREVVQDPKKLAELCQKIEKIGKPDYFPTYMVQHGSGAVFDNKPGSGLVSGFEPEIAWKGVMENNVHCPKAH